MVVKSELLRPHMHLAHAATSTDGHPSPDKARAATHGLPRCIPCLSRVFTRAGAFTAEASAAGAFCSWHASGPARYLSRGGSSEATPGNPGRQVGADWSGQPEAGRRRGGAVWWCVGEIHPAGTRHLRYLALLLQKLYYCRVLSVQCLPRILCKSGWSGRQGPSHLRSISMFPQLLT